MKKFVIFAGIIYLAIGLLLFIQTFQLRPNICVDSVALEPSPENCKVQAFESKDISSAISLMFLWPLLLLRANS